MHLGTCNDTRSILPDIYPALNINQVISKYVLIYVLKMWKIDWSEPTRHSEHTQYYPTDGF